MKKNAVYTVIETVQTHARIPGKAMVMKEEIIELEYHPEDDRGKKIMNRTKTIRLRKVSYQDEKNRHYEFLCNNMEISGVCF